MSTGNDLCGVFCTNCTITWIEAARPPDKKIPSEKSGGMRNFTYARALQTLKAAFLSQAGAL